mgnify:CR=1 FL=1
MISLSLVEIILRALPHSTLKFYDNDVFGSALVPNQKGWFVSTKKEYRNTVEVNSQGWPDIEHTQEKPEDIYRILILGDSFVENFQVPFEQRFFRQLQNRLGEKYEVIALGRGNTGTGPQYLILKNYGLKYKPDLVLHMFFEGNDIKNNSPVLQNDPFLPYFVLENEESLVEIPSLTRKNRFLTRLKEFLLNFQIGEFLLSVRKSWIEEDQVNSSGYPEEYHVYNNNYSQDYQKSWDVTKKLVLKTKELVQESGAQYVLVAIPANEQVYNSVQEKLIEIYPRFPLSKTDFAKPENILYQFCHNFNLDCLLTLDIFKNFANSNPSTPLYFLNDGHWTQEGVNLFAKTLYEKLENYLITK